MSAVLIDDDAGVLPPSQPVASSDPPPPFVPGVHDDIPAEDYHRIEALSSGGCKLLLRSPAHYWWQRENPREASDAMNVGTAVHIGVLEPERWDDEIVLMPKFNRRSNAGKAEAEAWEAAHVGKVWLDEADHAKALAIVGSVRRHPAAQRLLAEGVAERTLMWNDARHGTPCKARIDWHRPDGAMVDLKTTRDASPNAFGRQIADLMYHVQAAHYWIGAEHALDASPLYWAWIAVENEAPYCTAVYVLQADALRLGLRRQERAVQLYTECMKRGFWPGYSDLINPATLPGWALKETHE